MSNGSMMRGRFDSLLVLLVALPVYLATGQRTLYGVDGWRLLRRAATDDVRSEMHLLYKPMAVAAKQIGALLDVPMLESVVALSGVGTAVGVALVHAAARRFGLGRGDALWVAVLVGTAPGVWFYATVVERHGPFFAFVGLSAWALAWFAVRPGPWAALGFSLAVSLAYAAHSTGILLTAGYLPLWAWWLRQGSGAAATPWSRIVLLGGLAGFGAGGLAFVARRIGVWIGTVTQESSNFDFFLQHAAVHVAQPETIPINLAQEYLMPFLPLSVLAPAVFLRRGRRPAEPLLGAALLIAIGVYAAISFTILGDFSESGAYALPLAFPLAFAVVRCWSPAVRVLAVVIACSVSIAWIHDHDKEPLRPRADGLRALAGTAEPYLVAAAWDDFALLFGYFPAARWTVDYYDAFDAHGFDRALVEANGPLLAQALLAQSDGRPIFLSEQGERTLARPAEEGKAGSLVLDVLQQAFRFEPVSAGGFEGYRLEPR